MHIGSCSTPATSWMGCHPGTPWGRTARSKVIPPQPPPRRAVEFRAYLVAIVHVFFTAKGEHANKLMKGKLINLFGCWAGHKGSKLWALYYVFRDAVLKMGYFPETISRSYNKT